MNPQKIRESCKRDAAEIGRGVYSPGHSATLLAAAEMMKHVPVWHPASRPPETTDPLLLRCTVQPAGTQLFLSGNYQEGKWFMKLPYLDEPFPVFPIVTVEAWTAFSSLGVDDEP